ncbi:LAFE_0B07866g1_1 [Lachancea fermentati]|uniref:LAFE_0B07866g1_1 n=1 Tax=Lachancea fermentati TaxID=4955 RepID=A0A1G4M8C4_LACFM|nr:LAFE_0B07866g1_1 [Lachancea fermentati]
MSHGILDLFDYTRGPRCLVFSLPGHFTPACTTGIAASASLQHESAHRNCRLLEWSTNGSSTHQEWIDEIETVTGCGVQFPLVRDEVCTTTCRTR